MPSPDHLQSIRGDGERMLELATAHPEVAVPQYPEWTMVDLLEHTASIHGRTLLICRQLPRERVAAPQRPQGVDVADWFALTLAEMLDELEACDADVPVWGFGPEPTLGFWRRRMVIETGLHRWDAESAVGEARPLDPEVAIAGLDEFADMWFPRLVAVPTLQLTATDIGRSWTYGEGEAETRLDAAASDLYLALMGRPSPVRLPAAWIEACVTMGPSAPAVTPTNPRT